MLEIIIGLALLPAAIVVGFYLLTFGAIAIWLVGGWLLALGSAFMLANGAGIGGFICLVLGLMWGGYSASLALR